jgi:hypothetical protein
MCDHIEEIPWSSLRTSLGEGLAPVRDAIDEVTQLTVDDTNLIVARYPYGELMVEEGTFRPPCADCAAVLKKFDGPVPLAMPLDAAVEVFLPCRWDSRHPRHIPLRVIHPGEMFGVFETLDAILGTADEKAPWAVSSGVRSVWVLAPLGNSEMMKRFFGSLGYRKPPWMEGEPHWKLVQAFSTKKSQWSTRILLFPRTIVETLRSRREGLLFKMLLETGWVQSSALRHSASQESALHELLSPVLERFGGELYHFATIRQWLSILNGGAPGFCAHWKCNDSAGPFSEIENALGDLLKEWEFPYHPVLLRPALLSEIDSVYYSVRCPSLPGPPVSERAFTEAIGLFEDVLRSAKLFPEGAVQCFTKPARSSGERSDILLEGIPGSPEPDFLRNKNGKQVYWGSPFFKAGVRISRTPAKVLVARQS